jgi:MFS family permease
VTPAPRTRSSSARSLLLSLYLPSLLLSVCNGLLIPTLPLFASALDTSYVLVGLILAGDSLGMLLADVPAGTLLRRLGRKRSMLAGLLIAAASVLGLAFTTSITLLIVLRVLAGVGAALFNISRHVFMAEEIPRQTRGRAISLFGGTSRLGGFLGPAIGGFVAARAGFGGTFQLYALLAGVTFLLCWLFVERSRSLPAEVPSPPEPAGRPRGHDRFSRSQLATAGTGQLLAQLIRAGRRVLIPLFAANALGLGVEAVGLIVSISAALDFALFYPAGVIMDRYGRKHAIVPSFLIQAVSLALVPFTGGFTSLLLVASLGGFGNGISSGTMVTLGADLAPAHDVARFLGVWRLIGDTGAAAGPLLAGAATQALGLGPTAWVIALLGAGGALLFAYRMPETLRHRPSVTKNV